MTQLDPRFILSQRQMTILDYQSLMQILWTLFTQVYLMVYKFQLVTPTFGLTWVKYSLGVRFLWKWLVLTWEWQSFMLRAFCLWENFKALAYAIRAFSGLWNTANVNKTAIAWGTMLIWINMEISIWTHTLYHLIQNLRKNWIIFYVFFLGNKTTVYTLCIFFLFSNPG